MQNKSLPAGSVNLASVHNSQVDRETILSTINCVKSACKFPLLIEM